MKLIVIFFVGLIFNLGSLIPSPSSSLDVSTIEIQVDISSTTSHLPLDIADMAFSGECGWWAYSGEDNGGVPFAACTATWRSGCEPCSYQNRRIGFK